MAEYEHGLEITMEDLLGNGGGGSGGAAVLPKGEVLHVKCVNVEGKDIKGSPLVSATWEVTEGKYKGITFERPYWVGIRKSADGRSFAIDLNNFVRDATKFGFGGALPTRYVNPIQPQPLAAAARKGLKGKRAALIITERPYESKAGKKGIDTQYAFTPMQSGDEGDNGADGFAEISGDEIPF